MTATRTTTPSDGDRATGSRTTDVLIVGAGPTGLALACQLERYGIDCMVVERNAGVTSHSKAIGVHARTLEIYEQMGLAGEAIRRGAIAARARLVVGGQTRGMLELASIGADMSEYPFVLMLEQSRNEALLYEQLQGKGRDVEWRTTLESFTDDGDGVSATVRTDDGTVQRIDARYLVGCDGSKSPVRHALGLTFEGGTFERTFYVADATIESTLDHDGLQVCLAKDAFVVFFPLKGERRFRIVGVYPEALEAGRGGTRAIVFEEIERRIREESQLDLDIRDVEWFSTYKVHTRHTSAFAKGRCFLAGDAAHIHSPAGAQGMNTGIQDAYNLAWKLALVLRGTASPALLDTYDEERLANAKTLLETTDRLFQLAASASPLLSFMRLRVVPKLANRLLRLDAVQRFVFPTLSQIGIRYRESSLSDHDGDDDLEVKAGDRMPYVRVGGQSLFHRLAEPRFHWLLFSDVPNVAELSSPSSMQALRAELGPLAAQVDVHVLPVSLVSDLFGTTAPLGVLLRPDNYIAFVSRDTSAARVRRYLARLAADPTADSSTRPARAAAPA